MALESAQSFFKKRKDDGMEFWVTIGDEGEAERVALNTREDLLDDYTYFIEQAIAASPKAGNTALHKRFLRYALMATLSYTEAVVNSWLFELERQGVLSGADASEIGSLPTKMQAVCSAASATVTVPNFKKAKALYNTFKHFTPGKDKEVFEELSLSIVQRTFADLNKWISHMENALGILRHPNNETEVKKLDQPISGDVIVELSTTGYKTPSMKITILSGQNEKG